MLALKTKQSRGKLDVVGVQEVRWDKRGTVRAGDYDFFYRKKFGPRRDEVTGEWRRLHNKELNDMYSSPNIVRVIKSRIMR